MIRSHSHSLRAAASAGSLWRRAAFTLVELLVVIAIIALLVAIVTAGVFKVFGKRLDVKDSTDIKALEQSIGNFYAKWKVYPPDTIKLCHFLGDYDQTKSPDKESVQILMKIWPKLFSFSESASSPAPKNTPIAWAGYDKSTNPWTPILLPKHPITNQNCVVLQGDQCLVFFLGGVGGVHGFNESTTFPIDPMDHPKFNKTQANPIRFYEFLASGSRLLPRFNNVPNSVYDLFLPDDTIWPVPTPNHPFPSFLDNYADDGLPIVYFVGGNKKTYNELFHASGAPIGIPSLNVQPYFKNFDSKGRPQNYHNPSTFQIITAGLDHKFGGIGQWDNALTNVPGAGEDWKDNRANFHPNHLGVGQ
jgi:prepilin-type N-terminal cleavage/methylation domain-containing protein